MLRHHDVTSGTLPTDPERESPANSRVSYIIAIFHDEEGRQASFRLTKQLGFSSLIVR